MLDTVYAVPEGSLQAVVDEVKREYGGDAWYVRPTVDGTAVEVGINGGDGPALVSLDSITCVTTSPP